MSHWPLPPSSPGPSPMPPPPRRTRWWQRSTAWLKRLKTWQLVTLAISVSGLVLCTCCAALVVIGSMLPPVPTPAPGASQGQTIIAGAGATATMTPRPTATPTPKPTPKPTATATATPSGPHIVSGATLGGTAGAFQQRYGSPTTLGGQPSYTYIRPDGIVVEVCFCSTATGTDGQQRVDIVGFSSTDANWTPTVALSTAHTFMPPDAHYVGDLDVPGFGTLHVYQSADLAKTFPASEFTDSDTGQLVPPGTFSIICPDAQGQCTMATGR